MASNSLTGTMPLCLSNLPFLGVLSMTGNLFSGSLPPAYSAITTLSALFIGSPGLTGSLPPQYSTLTRLTYLNFYGAQAAITGEGVLLPVLGCNEVLLFYCSTNVQWQ